MSGWGNGNERAGHLHSHGLLAFAHREARTPAFAGSPLRATIGRRNSRVKRESPELPGIASGGRQFVMNVPAWKRFSCNGGFPLAQGLGF